LAALAFSSLAIWYAAVLAVFWLHRDGLLFASAVCQGLVAPGAARGLLTFGAGAGTLAILAVNAAA
jgi:hypothetical protein